jgi:hypothetical protein
MPFTSEELVALLRQYQAAVREAVALLSCHDFSTTLLAIYRCGPLDHGRASYAFHGAGCLVTLPDGRSVDFNFGFDERHDEARVDGLEPGFVADYHRQFSSYADHATLCAELTAHLPGLTQAGVLVQPDEHYPQYYFATDWHSPHPATYSPDAVPLDDGPAMLAQLDRVCYQLH